MKRPGLSQGRKKKEMQVSDYQLERDDRGVATFWFDNAKHFNALSNAMVIGLCEELPKLAEDESCRAIVLRGRNGVFCAGRELRDVQALGGADLDVITRTYDYMQKMNEVIYYAPQPVIAVTQKYALGIATMISTWADITIAAEGTLFGYPEVHHGITPYGAMPTLLNAMNQKAILELLLTGRRIEAEEAVRVGIVTRVVGADKLDEALEDVLALLFKGSPAAIRKSKQFLRECELLTYQQGIAAATDKAILGVSKPELREGLSAFLDKKKTA